MIWEFWLFCFSWLLLGYSLSVKFFKKVPPLTQADYIIAMGSAFLGPLVLIAWLFWCIIHHLFLKGITENL